MEKKYDLKLLFNETLYINFFRAELLDNISPTDYSNLNSNSLRINYVGSEFTKASLAIVITIIDHTLGENEDLLEDLCEKLKSTLNLILSPD